MGRSNASLTKEEMHSVEKALGPTEDVWIRMWNKDWANLHGHRGFKAHCLIQGYLKRIISIIQCKQSQSYK